MGSRYNSSNSMGHDSSSEDYDQVVATDENDPVLVDTSQSSAGRIALQRQLRPRRVALVVAVLVSDLFFTGLIFGWPSLLLMLKEENQFAELCGPGETTCSRQTNRLNLIFTLGSFAAIAFALPIGMFLDVYGPKITILVAAALELSGLVLMGVAESKSFDVFIVSFVLIALGGCVTVMASYPVSFLMLKYQTAIIASISCLFDACSVVFLVLLWIRSAYGVSRRGLFVSLAGFGGVVYLSLVVLWHLNSRAFAREQANVEKRRDKILHVNDKNPSSSSFNDTEGDLMGQKVVTEYYSQYGSLGGGALVKQPHASAVREACANHLKDPQMGILTAKDQMRTFEFGFLLAFGAIHVLRCTLFIGSINQQLENRDDATYHFLFTKLFNFGLSLGIVFLPAIDYVIESEGLSALLKLTNALGILYNAVALVPVLGLQTIGFVLFTGFRAFLYAGLSAFAAKTFGLRNLGTITGVISSAAALGNLLEYPTLYVADGHLTGMLVMSLVLCVLLVPLTEYQKRRSQRRQQESHQKMIIKFGFENKTIESHSPTSIYRGRSPSIKAPSFYAHCCPT